MEKQSSFINKWGMEIPYGYCRCGCGEKTKLSRDNIQRYGIVKGKPNHYVLGHSSLCRPKTLWKDGNKQCSNCQQYKPLSEFIKREAMLDGYSPECKKCYAQRHRKWKLSHYDCVAATQAYNLYIDRKFGLTVEDYKSMEQSQGFVCAICKIPNMNRSGELKRLVIDHNHTTGKVRGLLCNGCNTALGRLNDDPKMVMAALEYLKNHEDS